MAAEAADPEADFPYSFKCPISHEVMEDPVFLCDGHTYDRKSIEQWLRQQHTSPCTGRAVANTTLTPNYALRNAIDEFRQARDAKDMEALNKAMANAAIATKTAKFDVNITHSPNHATFVEVRATPGSKTMPLAIVFVLDISGSMSEPAAKNDGEGSKLSRFNLVMHSARAAIEMTKPDTLFGLVVFSDNAHTVLELTRMTEAGKAKAKQVIDNIERPNGGTHLYGGICMGVDIVKRAPDGFYRQVAVLTDGEPTREYSPPRGLIESIKIKVDENRVMISTLAYGMGNDLDSRLMYDIARLSDGHYLYIPDASMVGNVFVHFMANMLNKVAYKLKLEIPLLDGSKTFEWQVPHVDSDQPYLLCIDKSMADIPQDQDLVLLDGVEHHVDDESKDVVYKIVRYSFIVGVQQMYEYLMMPLSSSFDSAQAKLEATWAIVKQLADTNLDDERLSHMREALVHASSDKGQIGKAIDRDNWAKWGKHYLGSVVRAHMRQERSNFKDPDQSIYGGDKFKALIAEGEQKFKTLPPPVADVFSAPRRISPTRGGSPPPFHTYSASSSSSSGYGLFGTAIYPTRGSYRSDDDDDGRDRGRDDDMDGSLGDDELRLCDAGATRSAGATRNARHEAAVTMRKSRTSRHAQLLAARMASPPLFNSLRTDTLINSQALFDANGTCFGVGTLVHTPRGKVAIETLKKGDVVFTPNGDKDTVVCLTVSRRTHKVKAFNGATVTDWHPIRIFSNEWQSNSEWKFPADMALVETYAPVVYNLVLSKRSDVVLGEIGRLYACTLGHKHKGAVIEHEFYGTDKVVETLLTMYPNDYARGCVDWTNAKFVRDPMTGCVVCATFAS